MSNIDPSVLSLLKIGMEGTHSVIVSGANSADAAGYTGVHVLSTPHLVGFLELASMFVNDLLPENYMTVGTANDMKHLAATPLGDTIVAKARLTAINGYELTFQVEARDSFDKIAEGTHKRFVVDSREFFAKVERKQRKLKIDK